LELTKAAKQLKRFPFKYILRAVLLSLYFSTASWVCASEMHFWKVKQKNSHIDQVVVLAIGLTWLDFDTIPVMAIAIAVEIRLRHRTGVV
jgi:hypothetical protein